jgi:hypothetical protein
LYLLFTVAAITVAAIAITIAVAAAVGVAELPY